MTLKSSGFMTFLACLAFVNPNLFSQTESFTQFCETLATQMQEAETEPSYLNDRMDTDGFFDHILDGLSAKVQTKARKDASELKAGFIEGFAERKLGTEIKAGIGEDGSFEFLRLQKQDKRTTGIFRMAASDGINYYRLYLSLKNNQVYFDDMFIYATGERLSTSSARVIDNLLGKQYGIFDKLVGKEREQQLAFESLANIFPLLQQGKPEEARKIYDALPEDIKKLKFVQFLNYSIASETSEEEITKAYHTLIKHFPNDPSLALLILDGLILTGNFDAAMASLDQMEKDIGGDPYLDFMRANIMIYAEDMPAARKYALKAVKVPAAKVDAFDILIAVSLEQQNYDETVKWLKAVGDYLETEFPIELLQEDEAYAEFLQSDAYKKWQGIE